jgi:hypothetical protein
MDGSDGITLPSFANSLSYRIPACNKNINANHLRERPQKLFRHPSVVLLLMLSALCSELVVHTNNLGMCLIYANDVVDSSSSCMTMNAK